MNANAITLLDGGMGQELIRRMDGPAPALWSAMVLEERPDLVEAVHGEFIEAGAEVLTLSNYSVTPPKLARHGLEDRFEPLHRRAVAVAEAARDKSGRAVQLAGCLPPLVASYRPDLNLPERAMAEDYARLVAVQAAHVDLFLCETMTAISEALTATEAALASGKPVWTALSVDDANGARLRSGEDLAEAATAVRAAGAAAVLVNCSTPEATTQAMGVLSGLDLPFGAYANGFVSVAALAPGVTVDVLQARTDLGPQAYADAAMAWAEAGATIVGGCCEVGPAHIAELAHRLGRTVRPMAIAV
ncbi:MAG: homocysteine S-methyltransferase family protein [Pseudomonadota bacterium]